MIPSINLAENTFKIFLKFYSIYLPENGIRKEKIRK